MMQHSPFVVRPIYDDAVDLLARFGEFAVDEAAQRADRSRDAGNVLHFCHWRQTARAIAALVNIDVDGTLH